MLTEEQKKTVSENHNLIYGIASKMNLSIDEYYDILAIGLCKAAMSFDETRGAFSTFAYCCMRNEVYEYQRKLYRKTEIPRNQIVYYDVAIEDDGTGNKSSMFENIPDSDMHESVMYDIMSEELIERLSDNERHIVNMLLDGSKHEDIANVMDCTRQNITRQVKMIRDKAYRYLGFK